MRGSRHRGRSHLGRVHGGDPIRGDRRVRRARRHRRGVNRRFSASARDSTAAAEHVPHSSRAEGLVAHLGPGTGVPAGTRAGAGRGVLPGGAVRPAVRDGGGEDRVRVDWPGDDPADGDGPVSRGDERQVSAARHVLPDERGVPRRGNRGEAQARCRRGARDASHRVRLSRVVGCEHMPGYVPRRGRLQLCQPRGVRQIVGAAHGAPETPTQVGVSFHPPRRVLGARPG